MADQIITEAKLVLKDIDKAVKEARKVERVIDRIAAKAKKIKVEVDTRGLSMPNIAGGSSSRRQQSITSSRPQSSSSGSSTLSKKPPPPVVSQQMLGGLKEFLQLTNIAGATATSFAVKLGSIAGPAGFALAGVAALTIGIIGLGKASLDVITTAASFENTFAGVIKTTGITKDETRELTAAYLELSKVPSIGQTAEELAQIGQIAGTLGIKGAKNLEIFTATIARLASTSDIVGSQGTEKFGKLLAVTDTAVSKSSNLASVITVLAASFATTERAILKTGTETAKAGISFNLSAEDALAYAAVLDTFGVKSELARSAMVGLGTVAQNAVLKGGDSLERIAAIAGTTGAEFSKAFREDAGGSLADFIGGLANVSNITETIDDLGLKGKRLAAVVPTLAARVGMLNDAMAMAADESNNPSRIYDEAARVANTTQRRFETLRNEFTAVAIETGQKLLPSVDSLISTTSDAIATVEKLTPLLVGFAEGVIGIADAAIGTADKIGDIATGFRNLIDVHPAVSRFFSLGATDLAALGRNLSGVGEDFASFILGIITAEEDIRGLLKPSEDFNKVLTDIQKTLDKGDEKDIRQLWAGMQDHIGTTRAEVKVLEAELADMQKTMADEPLRDARGVLLPGAQESIDKVDELRKRITELKAEAMTYEKASQGLKQSVDDFTKAEEERLRVEREASTLEAERIRQIEERHKREEEGRQFAEQFKTDQEKIIDNIKEANRLFEAGSIVPEVYGRAINAARLQTIALKEELGVAFDYTIEAVEAIDRIVDKIELPSLSLPDGTDVDFFEIPDPPVRKYDKLADAAWNIADAFVGINDEIVNGIGLLGDMVSHFQALGDMGDATATQKLAAGAQMGQMVGGMAQQFGLFQGQRGTSSFGGQLSGDYGDIGSQAGGAIGMAVAGPVGAIVGSVLGGIVGGAIKSGADEGLAQLRDIGTDVSVRITKDEGGLGGVVASIGEDIASTFAGIEAALGAEITAGGLGQIIGGAGIRGAGVNLAIKIRDETIAVFVNGMRREFTDTADAVAFAVGEMIRTSDLSNVSEFMADALRNMRIDDVGELESTIQTLMEVDVALSGAAVTEAGEAFRQLRVDAANVKNVLRDVGAPMTAYVAWENKRINAIVEGVDALRASIIGFTDIINPLTKLQDEWNASNDVISGSIDLRHREAAALRAVVSQAEQAVLNAETQLEIAKETGQGSRLASAEVDTLNESLRRAQDDLANAQTAYDDFVASIGDIPEGISADAFAEAMNVGAAKGAGSVASMILGLVDKGMIELSAKERLELQQQMFELDQIITIAQLGAAQAQLEAMIALEQVSGATRDTIVALLGNFPNIISQVSSATFRPARTSRRGKKTEAQRSLDEFNATLATLELNASSATGQLGDLADTIGNITDEAAKAREAGASESDVRRFQQLSFRELRQEINPFDNAPETLGSQSRQIEQQRRGGVARARMFAESQGAALGLSPERIEQLFNEIVAEIDKGAKRAQAELVKGVIGTFDLPIENARRQSKGFLSNLRDLDKAFEQGLITGRRYKDLQRQIADQQALSFTSDALSFADKWKIKLDNQAELQIDMLQMEHSIELAILELKLQELHIAGLVSDTQLATYDEILETFRNTVPDFASIVAGDTVKATAARMPAMRATATATPVVVGLDSLLDSIRNFINGFQSIEIGPFEQTANDFLNQIQSFYTDFDQELGQRIGDSRTTIGNAAERIVDIILGQSASLDTLTDEQLSQLLSTDLSAIPGYVEGLEDVFQAMLDLQEAEALKPQVISNILGMYRGTEESGNALVDEFSQINSEFADVIAALTAIGASSMDIAQAEAIHLQHLADFSAQAVEGIRNVGRELRTGELSGISERQRVDVAQARFEELLALAEAGDLAAVSELDEAMMALAQAGMDFSDGFGPEYDLLRQQLIELSEQFELDLSPDTTMTVSDNTMYAKMDTQQSTLDNMHAAIETTNALIQGVEPVDMSPISNAVTHATQVQTATLAAELRTLSTRVDELTTIMMRNA